MTLSKITGARGRIDEVNEDGDLYMTFFKTAGVGAKSFLHLSQWSMKDKFSCLLVKQFPSDFTATNPEPKGRSACVLF